MGQGGLVCVVEGRVWARCCIHIRYERRAITEASPIVSTTTLRIVRLGAGFTAVTRSTFGKVAGSQAMLVAEWKLVVAWERCLMQTCYFDGIAEFDKRARRLILRDRYTCLFREDGIGIPKAECGSTRGAARSSRASTLLHVPRCNTTPLPLIQAQPPSPKTHTHAQDTSFTPPYHIAYTPTPSRQPCARNPLPHNVYTSRAAPRPAHSVPRRSFRSSSDLFGSPGSGVGPDWVAGVRVPGCACVQGWSRRTSSGRCRRRGGSRPRSGHRWGVRWRL
jgi:hypothetical protein